MKCNENDNDDSDSNGNPNDKGTFTAPISSKYFKCVLKSMMNKNRTGDLFE